jgi:hypothetical protein
MSLLPHQLGGAEPPSSSGRHWRPPRITRPHHFAANVDKDHLLDPNRPALIVVPPSLLSQWKEELNRWLKPGTADLFTYTGKFDMNNRKAFWTRVYSASRMPAYRRIILTTRTVC